MKEKAEALAQLAELPLDELFRDLQMLKAFLDRASAFKESPPLLAEAEDVIKDLDDATVFARSISNICLARSQTPHVGRRIFVRSAKTQRMSTPTVRKCNYALRYGVWRRLFPSR